MPTSQTRQPRKRTALRSAKKAKISGKPLPVTLVSGFLGSGKTSLLQHILTQKNPKERFCVLVNEISEFNVDAIALAQGKVLQTEEKLVEMSNGCICCTLREDLIVKLKELYNEGAFDRVIIESSGIAEPMQVAETFFFPVDGKPLQAGIAPLTHCVSVVDASTLESLMDSNEVPEAGSVNDKDISSLLFDQLEFANVIILNKIDLLDKNQSQETLIELVRKINPGAQIIPASHSEVNLEVITGAPLFTEQMALSARGWMEDVVNPKSSETIEYGISSFAFKSERPFHPTRLFDWITKHFALAELDYSESPEGDEEIHEQSPDTVEDEMILRKKVRDDKYGRIFRGKGFVWIASRSRLPASISWSQAGNILNMEMAGIWEDLEQTPQQRLIFIGQNLKADVLKQDLIETLLTDDELEIVQNALDDSSVELFEDPFMPLPEADLV